MGESDHNYLRTMENARDTCATSVYNVGVVHVHVIVVIHLCDFFPHSHVLNFFCYIICCSVY